MYDDRGFTKYAIIGFAAIIAILFGLRCFYTQDAGEVVVIRSWTGNLAGYSEEPGLHAKAPWQSGRLALKKVST